MRIRFLAACALATGWWFSGCVGSDNSTPGGGGEDGGASDASTGTDAPTNDAAVNDAGTDGGPSFSPTQIPGLVLWLDAAKGVVPATGPVTTWNDQSGNNNTAYQSDAGAPPTLTASAFHSLPAIHFNGFNGAYFQVNDAPSLDVGGDFLIEAVFDYSNTTNYTGIVTKQAAPYPFDGPCIIANFPDYADGGLFTSIHGQLDATPIHVGTATDALNNGAPHLFGFRRTGQTLEARLNGASSGTLADAGAIDITSVGRPTWVGNPVLQGDIAEVVIINGSISASDLSALEGYLKTKYGL